MPDRSEKYAYKIGESFPSTGQLPVSELDRKDGFLHMSTAAQVPATVGRFFRHTNTIELLKVPIERLDGDGRLRWEASRSHGVFPHV